MRISEIDAIKGLAIIGVLIAHLSFEGRFDTTTLDLVNQLQILFGWCVIAFFFCSGILVKNQPKTIQEMYDFIQKKFVRLIIPYVIFNVLNKIALTVYGKYTIPKNVVESIMFFVSPIFQYYFLCYLFVISVLVCILGMYFSKHQILMLSGLVLSVSYLFVKVPQLAYGPIYALLPIYIFSYVMGYALSEQYEDINLFFYLIILVPIMFTAILSNSFLVWYTFVPLVLLRLFCKFPAVTSLFNQTQLGKYSSSIFVWHTPILMPFLSIVFVKLIGGQPIVILGVIVFTIFICLIINQIILKYDYLRFLRF